MRRRRGIALIDALVGGIMLSVGLAGLTSVVGRSLKMQTTAEKRITASWLADEILNMVLAEGPRQYTRAYDLEGDFDEPFEQFSFEITIEDPPLGVPANVTATVYWATGEVVLEGLIAERQGDEPNEPREPEEFVDRDARYYDDEE